ncbi:MAG: FeoB-associated Cys-rich membrane protein [Thermoguttaceae bacterium]|jgi:hypothetical protein
MPDTLGQDIAVLGLLVAAVWYIVRRLRRTAGAGRGPLCGGCRRCPGSAIGGEDCKAGENGVR